MPRRRKQHSSKHSTERKKEKPRKTSQSEPGLNPQEPLETRIFKALSLEPGATLNFKQLTQQVLGTNPDHVTLLTDTVNELLSKNLIIRETEYRYRLNFDQHIFEAVVESNRDGLFVTDPTSLQPVYLEFEEQGAFVGDRVSVRLVRHGRKGFKGQIQEVIQPARSRFVGTLEVHKVGMFFIPQDSKVKPDFWVPEKYALGARHGDRVEVEVFRWRRGRPEAKVIQVLGAAGSHQAEMHAIILEYGLDTQFPEAVLAEAAALADDIPPEEALRRRDMRGIATFTIDPIDAKDFDDAISFRVLDNGNYEVGVHIADVSYYVPEHSALDREALNRATSVYLVDRTVPMLPERLSNDLCSLKPHVDRLTYSAIFELTPQVKIVNEWFGRCIIHSNRRFTYEEAQEVLETKIGQYAEELSVLNDLAYKLRAERFRNGSISFETQEVKFKLAEDGTPLYVYAKERKDAHKLIEDFMLLANRQVAAYIGNRKRKQPVPMVYRVHDKPDASKLEQFATFVKVLGHELPLDNEKQLSKSLNRLMTRVEGRPEQNLVQAVAIRAMAKAVYTTQNIGHFGLGFSFYTHFTSPIRRYPDILCHRVLDAYLNKRPFPDLATLEAQCKHSSEREKRASDAERASIKYKQVEFLSTVLGEEFEGVVSGVTDWGLYVELTANKCEGMIPLRELFDDYYAYDEANFQLVGRRFKKVFRLGDLVRIRVKKTNLLKRQIDFEFLGRL
jgi:ribonuclease R